MVSEEFVLGVWSERPVGQPPGRRREHPRTSGAARSLGSSLPHAMEGRVPLLGFHAPGPRRPRHGRMERSTSRSARGLRHHREAFPRTRIDTADIVELRARAGWRWQASGPGLTRLCCGANRLELVALAHIRPLFGECYANPGTAHAKGPGFRRSRAPVRKVQCAWSPRLYSNTQPTSATIAMPAPMNVIHQPTARPSMPVAAATPSVMGHQLHGLK